ncbi:UNVERIFIED_CONTAM: hypothetical protein GTU68_044025, partial [Idotea baltica]|nr:hypothetical protein [Idotea baltica]
KKIIIAIDGHAGCGKSTTAIKVAQELAYIYITSGAMYRSAALYFHQNGIDFSQENPEMLQALADMNIEFREQSGGKDPLIFLNDTDVSNEIRTPFISDIVSPVSVHPSVREAMVHQQRRIGKKGGIVMDGRDIGTVVFPQAELKIFMTASLEARAGRRLQEMKNKGMDATLEYVIENLQKRDYMDSNRTVSPLKQAEDAIVLDTTLLTIDEQVKKVCELARKVIAGQNTFTGSSHS